MRHKTASGHVEEGDEDYDDDPMDVLSEDEFLSQPSHHHPISPPHNSDHHSSDFDSSSDPNSDLHLETHSESDPLSDSLPDPLPNPQPNPLPNPLPNPDDPESDWHPFRSRVHCQLVLLYHGSHRRNVDLVTFGAFMQILKVSVLIYMAVF